MMTEAHKEKLSASMEDYLEAIYHLVAERRVARARAISKKMNVRMSSVTGALKHLADHDLVNYEPYQYVTLTKGGEQKAKRLVYRHRVLRDFLTKVLGVEPAKAEESACGMEHAVEPGVLQRFLQFLEFVERCPRAGVEWAESLDHFCENGTAEEDCERCVETCLKQLRTKKRKEGNARRCR